MACNIVKCSQCDNSLPACQMIAGKCPTCASKPITNVSNQSTVKQ